jgi:GTP pyrophosphokinase
MMLSQRFSDALVYAARLHRSQRRKVSGTPYVGHLLRVAGIVLEYGADEDEAIAALLHDAVEDQGGAAAREAILRQFGPCVAEIVDGCTDAEQSPKPPWRKRKDAHLARLAHASPSVRLVAAADKLDNVCTLMQSYRTMGESVWERFRGGRDGSLWYLRSVVNVLKQTGTHPLLEELDRAVAELARLVAPASDGPAP